jgi:hypothetical protein
MASVWATLSWSSAVSISEVSAWMSSSILFAASLSAQPAFFQFAIDEDRRIDHRHRRLVGQHDRPADRLGRHLHDFALLDGADGVAFGDMGDLVSQHPAELSLALHQREGSARDVDKPARRGEGVTPSVSNTMKWNGRLITTNGSPMRLLR